MSLYIVNSSNTHLIGNVFLDPNKNKLVIVGEKNKNFYQICKNVSFVKNIKDSKKFISLFHKVMLIDQISYIDPNGIRNINSFPDGSFFCSNLCGSDELYMMQVMGHLPEYLNGTWNDNYIENCDLDKTDLADDFIEKYSFNKDKNKFYYNKFMTNKFHSVLITTEKNKLYKSISSNSFKDILKHFSKSIFISSKIWYCNIESEIINERLYKSH